MLHKEAAEPNTWRVLEKLMGIAGLDNFHLAGGTTLALRFRHRLSIDIDMFCHEMFDKNSLPEILPQHFPDFREQKTNHKKMYFCIWMK